MNRLGYTYFINKHKTLFFSIFVSYFVVCFFIPLFYIDLTNASINWGDGTLFSYTPLMLCIRGFQSLSICKNHYNEIQHFSDKSFGEYYASVIKYYTDGILSILFTILIFAILIWLVIRFFKTKSISRLMFIPYCLTIISDIAILIADSVLNPEPTFVPLNLIITLLFSIPVFLYCLNFQRFGKPREHKPSDKERIAELERQVAELQKEKDVE